ncbi:sigma-70 family RNA polymerase sigma factor [Tepidanaerobacter sp. GT38]|uniref:sigma-70 family RNA polymerase sigma factor n=1 Tax=Tepidanaerobacter sp. GT38 TaxID=2722793 RepID=UPI001F3F9C9A|nr:sigma-70 family RNA polymerase sigma factor [Tepidanaerobacter sp. GT38]MCG1011904.1 sigma-70 family RNA polymerase sigma factor [Tepidanaerobacter sp. GT38]
MNAPVSEDDGEEMIRYIEDENVNVAEHAIDDLVIQEALSILTEKQRTVIVDKFFYGYTETEIAQKMGISRQSVNRLNKKALLKLNKMFWEQEHDGT